MSACNRRVIRADGSVEPLPMAMSMSALKRLIGAETLDIVNLRDGVHMMLVDDSGHARRLPVNDEATRMYHAVCRPGATHQIVGDVAIIADRDFA